MSLLPFATAWIARTRLASSPVAFYAGLFVCIDIAYNVFEREVLARADATLVSEPARRMARRRSLVVLAIFTVAMLVAFAAPRLRADMRRLDPPLAARGPRQSTLVFAHRISSGRSGAVRSSAWLGVAAAEVKFLLMGYGPFTTFKANRKVGSSMT